MIERIGMNSAMLDVTDDELILCRDREPLSGVAATVTLALKSIFEAVDGVLYTSDVDWWESWDGGITVLEP